MLIIRFGEDVGDMNYRYDGPQLKHGNTAVLMNQYICLYTLWIPALEIGILKLNFAEVLKIGLY